MPLALLQYPQREMSIREFYLHANNLRTLPHLPFLTQPLVNCKKRKLNVILLPCQPIVSCFFTGKRHFSNVCNLLLYFMLC